MRTIRILVPLMCLLFLATIPAHATYTFVSIDAKSGGSGVITLSTSSISVTAGQLMVCEVIIGNATQQSVSGMSDTQSNIWHRPAGAQIFNSSLFGGTAVEVWYSIITNAGSTTITSTWASGGGYSDQNCSLYTVPAGISLDVVSVKQANGTNSVGPFTTGFTNELEVGSFISAGSSLGPASGFTARDGGAGGNEDSFTNSAGSTTVSNVGTSSQYAGVVVAFTVVSSPPSGQQCKKGNGGVAATNYTVTIAGSGGTTGCTSNFTAGDMIAVGYNVGNTSGGTITDLTTSSISATGATITWRKAFSIHGTVFGNPWAGILYACPGDITSPTSSIAITVNMGASYAGMTSIFVQEISGIQSTGCYDTNTGAGTNGSGTPNPFSAVGTGTSTAAVEFIFADGFSWNASGIAFTAGLSSDTGSWGNFTIPAQGTDSESDSTELVEYVVTSTTRMGTSWVHQGPAGSWTQLVQAGFISGASSSVTARHRIIEN